MSNTKSWLAIVVFFLQSAPAAAPIRIGDFARQLTSQDVTKLKQLATAGGFKGSPWLLEGPLDQKGDTIRMYLPAGTQTAQLQSGTS